MDHKLEILEREDLRHNPYTVPEGFFDQLQERLGAIPRQEVKERNRILPALSLAAGIAAAVAACFILIRPAGPEPGVQETWSYEQFAYADLIPHTEPYIYFAEEMQADPDPAEEELIDYLMQYPNY